MGCMRLSTERDGDEARAIRRAARRLRCRRDPSRHGRRVLLGRRRDGHNERLIAQALSTWIPRPTTSAGGSDRSRILVATKGGLTRPQGNWRADGRARYLVAACRASLRALNVDRIDLYQLHAPDPRTSLATSVRGLASLKRDCLLPRIGLCNVNVGQIEEARRITEIDAVQVELSVWNGDNFLSGVAEYCVANGIQLIAYRPLGGSQRGSQRAETGEPYFPEIRWNRHAARRRVAQEPEPRACCARNAKHC